MLRRRFSDFRAGLIALGREWFERVWQIREEAAGDRNTDHDMGAGFDFDDDTEMRRRLPRLASLFLPAG